MIAETFPTRIPIPVYDALDAERYSHLKYILKSPRHFRHVRSQGTVQTSSMALGSACHSAILEPDKFESDYAVWTNTAESGKSSPRRGKVWDHFRRMNPGKEIITAAQNEIACAMRDAVRADPLCMQFLAEGEAEIAMVWTDPATGIKCRGRMDWLTFGEFRGDNEFVPDRNGEPVIVGIKTAAEPGLDLFKRQATRLLYHMQWGMYREGYEILTGRTARVVEIVVESKAPHDPVVYEIGPEVIDPGLTIYHEALAKVAECRAADHWPGIGEGKIQSMALTSWAAGIPEDVSFDMSGIDTSALEGLEV